MFNWANFAAVRVKKPLKNRYTNVATFVFSGIDLIRRGN
jgi:hypothetical protein